jgi:hypothetical protein
MAGRNSRVLYACSKCGIAFNEAIERDVHERRGHIPTGTIQVSEV